MNDLKKIVVRPFAELQEGVAPRAAPRSYEQIKEHIKSVFEDVPDGLCMCGDVVDHGPWSAGHQGVDAQSYMISKDIEELIFEHGWTRKEALILAESIRQVVEASSGNPNPVQQPEGEK